MIPFCQQNIQKIKSQDDFNNKNKTKKKMQKNMPADNGRFGASGGVGSSESEQETLSFALVQAFVIPPPAPSRWDVICKQSSAVDKDEWLEKTACTKK